MRLLGILGLLALVWGCDDGAASGDGGTDPGDAAGDVALDAQAGDAGETGDASASPDGSAPDGAVGDGAVEGDVRLIEGPTPNFDGRVMGLVRGEFAGRQVPVVQARVWLQTEAGDAQSLPVGVDGDGRYETPLTPLGTYVVCAAVPGVPSVCSEAPLTIAEDSRYHVQNLEIPLSGAIVGQLVQADGTPCGFSSDAFEVSLRGQVSLGDLTVETDAKGGFVLAPLPPSGDYQLNASCGGAEVQSDWAVEPEDALGEPRQVTLQTSNTPPAIGAIAFVDEGGAPVRRATPGQRVYGQVRVVDEDEDEVELRVVDAHGEPLAVVAGAFEFDAPEASVQMAFLALADDGNGGLVETRGLLNVGDRLARVGGRVVAPDGSPVVGASVNIGRPNAITDEDGRFQLEIPDRDEFAVAARAEGFQRALVRVDAETSQLEIRMQPVTTWSASPFEEHTLQDEAGFAQVNLPRGSMQLPRRAVEVMVDVTGYDPTRPVDFPGSGAALGPEGEPMQVQLLAAMTVEMRLEDGTPVPLNPDEPAELQFPAPPNADGERPETVALLSLDEGTGVWQVEGEAALIDGVYVGQVTHFSTWSVGLVSGEEEACIRVDIAPELLNQFRLRVRGPNNAVLGEWIPTLTINAVRHMSPWTLYRFDVVSLTDPTKVIKTYSESSRNPSFNGWIGYPYINGNDGCNGWLRIKRVLPRERWLDRFHGSEETSWQYYNLIGYQQGLTLSQWKAQWGFTPADEAAAVAFYNPQEFGLGRRGVCHTRGSTIADLEMACCVAKYGHVGEDWAEAVNDTVNDTHVGDTVCMEYSAGPGPERIVKFLAFKPTGELSARTYFDTSGPKYVPEVCGHCHGRKMDWKENNGDQGGVFVFFDAPAYRYASWNANWTKLAQEERLRELNRYVKMTHGDTGPHADYIDSLYHEGVDTPGASSSEPEVLPAWQNDAQTFQKWIRPNCRTCHMWQGLDFAEPGDFGSWISTYVCDGIMPNAMQPMLNVWNQLDPFPGDAINNAFGGDPCFSSDQAPSVQITSPADNTEVTLGGLFGVRFTAEVSDVEDGPDCCAITWTSDKDGILGFGRQLDRSLASPGIHRITVTARDSRYRTTSRGVSVRAVNDPPEPRILFPENDDDSLFEGVPYVIRGKAVDPNEPLGLPCAALHWTSDNPQDAFPFDACHSEVTFQGNGPRVLRLRARDKQGTVATVERRINVPDPPLNAPPIVTILSPVEDASHPVDQPLQIRGSAVDPDGNAAVDWTVSAKFAFRGDEAFQVIGQGQCAAGELCRPTFNWNAQEAGFRRCGGASLQLMMQATDPNGTGRDRVTYYAASPPC